MIFVQLFLVPADVCLVVMHYLPLSLHKRLLEHVNHMPELTSTSLNGNKIATHDTEIHENSFKYMI